ncbi:BamA/TamA family outer membrane protein [Vibrio hippocampi]|uniref:Bacterial surface antigen (D15) domain-containing protein n=1 Tax=Vibrio hippocampi TaxID=654686 RepID=A0ABM8ZNB2_9VIBR|nr:BamA/TamA family outer membrane protein [Vibrio hippocampi]CAH0530066.1 hypothetical protein VHP8226_03794 [Vibrio hippocampi]
MTYPRLLGTVCSAICLMSSSAVFAAGGTPTNIKSRLDRLETSQLRNSMVLPYFFSSDSMGTNIGVGGMIKGIHQDQMVVGGTIFGGTESHALSAGIWNYMIPGTERVFLSTFGMWGYYPKQRAYTGYNVPAGTPLPGSNDSSSEQYFEGSGNSNWWDIKLEYVLPIGANKHSGTVDYQVKNGLLVSAPTGGREWNPLTSGTTIFVARQFNRYQSFETDSGDIDGTIHAMEFGVYYDNTDFAPNPSYGTRHYISTSHDWGWLESKQEWSFYEFDTSAFFSLGESHWASQRIVALNFWTGYSPTWEVESDSSGNSSVSGNAPYNEGATLGGFTRMRGYDMNRFHDKAVIYGAAEYRYTLRNNPLKDVNWLKFLRIDWIQLVGFAEVGRVGPEYNASNLLTDMKYDAGVSVRALMAGLVVRTELATSPESTNFWLMVDHPF